MNARVFGAVDLGASGGRVIAGVIEGGRVSLDVIHRFPNRPEDSNGHLRWNITGLYEEILIGLNRLREKYPSVESIGIDTWGVDYGLLDAGGRLLAEPIAYRDGRTAAVVNDVHDVLPPDELFAINGLQFLPFNTIYQLAAEMRGPLWAKAVRVALLPDLIAYWLTDELRTEYTNASTTGLVDVRTRDWSHTILERLHIAPEILPPIEQPGAVRGTWEGLRVTTVASHDTASAVVGVPATTPNFAYIASGTWSLVGLEIAHPILMGEARAANVTNEGGVDGRTRFLKNVGGLWLLQESLRERGVHDPAPMTAAPTMAAQLMAEAASLPAGGPVIDVDDAAFLHAGAMPERIRVAAASTGQAPPETPAQTVRCIIDSLAMAYGRTLRAVAELAGATIDVVHLVGGGSQNDLLCQMTADFARRPVIAGPAEATALGNILIQARAHGALPEPLEALRACIAPSVPPRRFAPR